MKEYAEKHMGPNGQLITRMIPLRPCPFCGFEANIKDSGDAIVGCFNSGCTVHPKVKSACENSAVKRWNVRTNPK